jgi:hypothetical protein
VAPAGIALALVAPAAGAAAVLAGAAAAVLAGAAAAVLAGAAAVAPLAGSEVELLPWPQAASPTAVSAHKLAHIVPFKYLFMPRLL